MSLKECPIVAIIVFKNGNSRPFRGDRYEKNNKIIMLYNLKKMITKHWDKIKSVRIFDNTIMPPNDKIIFEYDCEVSATPKINRIEDYFRIPNTL